MKTGGQKTDVIEDGLRFKCTGCGKCCTDEPGTIAVNDEEIDTIAKFLGIPRARFVKEYLYRVPKGYSIRERSDYDCYFFSDGKCNIYSVRPTQCRTWPFWRSNVRSEADWQEVCEDCPGIGRGKLHTREEILTQVAQAF